MKRILLATVTLVALAATAAVCGSGRQDGGGHRRRRIGPGHGR